MPRLRYAMRDSAARYASDTPDAAAYEMRYAAFDMLTLRVASS